MLCVVGIRHVYASCYDIPGRANRTPGSLASLRPFEPGTAQSIIGREKQKRADLRYSLAADERFLRVNT